MKSKIIASVLILVLLFSFASVYLPSTATAVDWGTITWWSFWMDPEYVAYWDTVIAAYEAEKAAQGITVNVRLVTYDFYYLEAYVKGFRYLMDNPPDPDMVYIDPTWIPNPWTNWWLAIPPSNVQADVKANWPPVTVEESTYKSIVWGYPGEFNSLALVYNKKLFRDEIASRAGTPEVTFLNDTFNKLETDQPLNWTELTDAAILLTKWNTTVTPPKIEQRGFIPFVEHSLPEEERYQFLSMLWSTGGEFLDLLAPEAKFNGTEGKEVMQLYYDLGFVHKVYDPQELTYSWPPYWWDGWADETIAMMILPSWMSYIQYAMPGYFDHLGVAPIPIGPSGTESKSATSTWLNVVTQAAVERGTDEAAWDFLKWINEPKPAGYITIPDVGDVPKHDGTSIMGNFLIYHELMPSRISDQADPRLLADFWKSEFLKFGSPPYGRLAEYFRKSDEVEDEIGRMFEKVTVSGEDPTTTIDEAAAKINAILPMPGDINLDGTVDIYDVPLMAADIDAVPNTPEWNRGRSEFVIDPDTKELIIDVLDITTILVNYGRVGGSL